MQGQIKFFKENKGYGFIAGDDQNDYFFHISSVVDTEHVPKKGETIEFKPSRNEKGKTAIKIRRVE